MEVKLVEENREGLKKQFGYWHYRGYLPHFEKAGNYQIITFRLSDSIAQKKYKQICEHVKLFEESERNLKKRILLDEYIDGGLGSCILAESKIAQIVKSTFLFGNGERYNLIAWVIMPNHIHLLIKTNDDWTVSKIVQSIKRHTSKQINIELGKRKKELFNENSIWSIDYYDRFIRDEDHFNNAVDYIHMNPVKAGLCKEIGDWRWSSACEDE